MPADHRVLLAGIVLWCASTAIVRLPRVNEPVSVVGVRPAIADFDGDHRTDWTVRRPDTGIWYSILSGSGTAIARTWGLPTDVDVAADFDGDGTTDLAAWRVGPQGGEWWIVNSADGTVRFDVWEGDEGDVPMAGDVDGDGKADQVIFRPRSGEWWVKTSGGVVSHHFWGQSSDQPLLADVDGDGRDDFVIFRPYGDWWALLQGGGFRYWRLGLPDDIPVIGDFDGDGLADPTVFRPSSGQWWVLQSTTGTLRSAQWGLAGDVPMRGDVDGDGRSDFIVWRPDAGAFFAQYSSAGSAAVGWGVPGDQPVGRMWGTTGGGTITFSGLTIDAAPITRYVENGFTLARVSGTWAAATMSGNPAPFIQFGSPATGDVFVWAAGLAQFRFESLDVYSSVYAIPYLISGWTHVGFNGTPVLAFQLSGTLPNPAGHFMRITNPSASQSIDYLEIQLSNTNAALPNPMGIDNIVLRP